MAYDGSKEVIALGGNADVADAADKIAVDTSDFDTPGAGTTVQDVLVELEARIAAIE